MIRRLIEIDYNHKYLDNKDKNLLKVSSSSFNLFSVILFGTRYIYKLFTSEFFIFSASERRKRVNGQFEDRVMGGIINKVRSKCIIIENPLPLYKHFSGKETKDKYIISDAFISGLSIILGSLLMPFKKVENEFILTAIEKKYDLKINCKIYLKRYLGQYYLYSFILLFNKPKQVFIAYLGSWYGAIHAFKKNDVTVIECQHGVINDRHPFYNYYIKTEKLLFPDKLLTYGNIERKYLKNANYIDLKRVIPTGYYFLDRVKEAPSKVEVSKSFNYSVVFSHQDLFEKKAVPVIIKLAKQNPEIAFFIAARFETNEIKKLRQLSIKNIIFEPNVDIYELIVCCDIHITVNSTTTLEALYLNTSSILIDVNGIARKYFGHLESDSIVFLNEDEEFVDTLIRAKQAKIDEEQVARYFSTNYLKNISAIIQD